MSVKAGDQKEPNLQSKSSADVPNRSSAGYKSSRNESKELPSRSALSSDKSRSHWNKLKALRLQNNASQPESIRKLNPEEKSVWKNAKLFSKTTPAIDGIGPTKKSNISQISGELSAPESHQKNISGNPSAISSKWATSQSAVTAPAAKQSEWKLLKSKLNLLRRKGNRDFDCVETAIIAKDSKEAKEANARPISGKHCERSAQISQIQSSIPAIESILSKRNSSPEEKGIICKKEDLMHIMAKASKTAKLTRNVSVSGEDVSAVASGLCASTSGSAATTTSFTKASASSVAATDSSSIRRTALKKQHSCGSESSCERTENQTKQSNTRTKCLDSSEAENAYKNQYMSKTNTTKGSDESDARNAVNYNNLDQNECESRLRAKNKSRPSMASREPMIVINETNLDDNETDSQTRNEGHNDNNESESNVPAVQWDDDINLLDPSLLGDAIQTFLRGLAGSSTNEKRVSFKKSF